MLEGNQIDNLFEASLNGLEAKPSEGAWDRLRQELEAVDGVNDAFDAEVNTIMSDFKVQPSSSVWAGLDQHLEAAAVAAASFDSSANHSLKDLSQAPSENVWHNIETELDYIDAANVEAKRRFAMWFAVSASLVASLLFFFMHFSPQQFIYKPFGNDYPLVNSFSPEYENTIITTETTNKEKKQIYNSKNIAVGKSTAKKTSTTQNIIEPKRKVFARQNKNVVIATFDNSNSEKTNLLLSQNDNTIAEEIIRIHDFELDNMPSKNMLNPDGLSSLDLLAETNIRLKSIKAVTGFSLDLFVGPELIINKTDQNSSVGDEAILEEIQPFTTDYTFGTNIKFHYNNFFVQSGLTYSNYGDQRLYQQNTEMHDTSGGFITYNINSYVTYDTIGWVDDPLQPGGLSPQLSANFHSDTVGQHWNSQDSLYANVEKYSAKIRYRYIEIPIMLGYKYDYKHFGFSLGAGVTYGFKIAEQGKYIDNGTLKTSFFASSPYSQFTTNGIISLGISYSISNKISVIIQPTYKTNLLELNNLSVSYQNLSLRMGINILL